MTNLQATDSGMWADMKLMISPSALAEDRSALKHSASLVGILLPMILYSIFIIVGAATLSFGNPFIPLSNSFRNPLFPVIWFFLLIANSLISPFLSFLGYRFFGGKGNALTHSYTTMLGTLWGFIFIVGSSLVGAFLGELLASVIYFISSGYLLIIYLVALNQIHYMEGGRVWGGIASATILPVPMLAGYFVLFSILSTARTDDLPILIPSLALAFFLGIFVFLYLWRESEMEYMFSGEVPLRLVIRHLLSRKDMVYGEVLERANVLIKEEEHKQELEAIFSKKFADKLADFKKTAWKPVTKKGNLSIWDSKFGGTVWIHEDEPWPYCPNCNRRMQLFVQLNLSNLNMKEFGAGIMQMFYCTTVDDDGNSSCEIDQKGWAPFSKNCVIRLLQADSVTNVNHLTSPAINPIPLKIVQEWQPVDDYPCGDELADFEINLSDEEQELFAEIGFPLDGDKLGGWPDWIQGVDYPNCPKCGRKMRLLLQIDSEDNIPYMWGDGGCGYITQCPDHKDVMAFQWAGH